MILKSIKNISVIVALVFVFQACGPYQKALKSNEVKPKYDLAMKYYKQGLETGRNSRFKRSIRLLEQILPQYRGKPQGQKLAFIYADCYYQLEAYFDAGYQFERFVKSYGQSNRVGEAAFKSAKSYYFISPRYSLDQTDTHKAMDKLQSYIANHPAGEHIGEANEMMAELREKLEKKQFETANLYYVQEDYKAAVASMNNFVNENPGSPYLESAYYIRMNAEYVLAINSFRNVMEERLEKAKVYAQDYLKYYAEGEHVERANMIFNDVSNRLKEF